MARIVEFCGAPGTGKSTLYNELVSNWRKEHSWIPGHKLYPLVEIHYKSVSGFINTVIARIKRRHDHAAMGEAASRFIRENREFIDCCWGNIYYEQKHSFNGVDNRFRAAEIWLQIVRKLQVIKESHCSKIAVVDEGLIQRLDSALFKSKNFEEEKTEIAAVLEKMMLPMAVIYIDADPEVSIARMKARKKKLPFFDSLSSSELRTVYEEYRNRWLYAFELLNDKSIPVLTVDATKEVKQNVALILNFLENLNIKHQLK